MSAKHIEIFCVLFTGIFSVRSSSWLSCDRNEDVDCCANINLNATEKSNVTVYHENDVCIKYDQYPQRLVSPDCYEHPLLLTPLIPSIFKYGGGAETYSTKNKENINIYSVSPRFYDESIQKKNQVVFLQEGFLTGPEVWMDKGSRSLAHYLSMKGYEVYIGVPRNNVYTKAQHKKEINYDIEELSEVDMVELLNIWKPGGDQRLVYIGHSFGATYGLLFAAANPEKASKFLRGIIALAPVVGFENTKLKDVIVNDVPTYLDAYEKLDRSNFSLEKARRHLVDVCTAQPNLCVQFLERAFGKSDQLKPDDMPVLVGQLLGNVSIPFLKNIVDIAKTGQFQGYKLSDKRTVDFKKIPVPVYTFYGETDTLSTKKDLQKFVENLETKNPPQPINPGKNFNHFDFLYAKDIKELLYEPLVKLIEEMYASL